MEKYTYSELDKIAQMRARANVLKEKHAEFFEYLLKNKYNIDDLKKYIEELLGIPIISHFDFIWSESPYLGFVIVATFDSAVELGLPEHYAKDINGTPIQVFKGIGTSHFKQMSFYVRPEVYDDYIDALHDKLNEVFSEINQFRKKCIDTIRKEDILNYLDDSDIYFDKYGNVTDI